MISVRGVSKRFGENVAVDDVSFEAGAGSITYLLGPNGAGKTTVTRMVAGLTQAGSGSVVINGTGCWNSRTRSARSVSISVHSPATPSTPSNSICSSRLGWVACRTECRPSARSGGTRGGSAPLGRQAHVPPRTVGSRPGGAAL
ncbi:ATP-binding cassette domain-containing protein [Nocardia sputi]|uniref:ATP-binding cassette domain-containing protein n=1 Tax=Nocardia TaxID=1817 RepID=UPI00135AB21C